MFPLKAMKNSIIGANKPHLQTPAPRPEPTVFNTPLNPLPRELTETSSSCFSNVIDEKSHLIEKIESMRMQLAESQRREEYLRGINQTLRDVITKLQAEQKVSARQDKPPENIQITELTEYYERKIQEIRAQYEEDNRSRQQQYMAQVENIRVDLEQQMQETLNRQKQLMENQMRVHFQKEKVKAESYLRNLIHGIRNVQSPSFFMASPKNSSFDKDNIFRAIPQLQPVEKHNPSNSRHEARQLHLELKNLQPANSITPSSRQSASRKSLQVSQSNRNIATDLLCQNCNTSFPPTEFFPHAKYCRPKPETHVHPDTPKTYYPSSKQSQVIDLNSSHDEHYPSKSSSEQSPEKALESDEEDIDLELMQALMKKKDEIQAKIQMLKYPKGQEQRIERDRLQTDLDQIILIIQRKKSYKVRSSLKQNLDKEKKPLRQRNREKNVSYCDGISSSLGKNQKNIEVGRGSLEDRPLQKKPYTKQSQGTYRSVASNRSSATPTNRRFLKRFL